MGIEDDDRFMYDDGRFADDGEEERDDDFDIPTYDELDLEGRYYTYGSREEYNEWRYYKIQELKEERRKEQYIRRMAQSNRPNEYNDVAIPDYDSLTEEEKNRYESRDVYDKWKNGLIRRRRNKKIYSFAAGTVVLIFGIAVIGFIVYIFSFFLL